MKVEDLLIIVPARGGSKRLPGKHLRRLAGRTLLEWTQMHLVASRIDAACLLSTDDADIAAAGRRLGWTAPFLRPSHLATDTATTMDTVLHALDWYAANHDGEPALTMVAQTTSPLRGSDCFRIGLQMLRDRPGTDAVISVKQVQTSPGRLFTVNAEEVLDPLDTEVLDRPVYAPNGALYLIRTAVLRRERTFSPARTLPLIMDEIGSIDIDNAADWELAEAVLHDREGRIPAPRRGAAVRGAEG